MDHPQKIDNSIAAVQFKIRIFNFHYWSTQIFDFIYVDIYCKSKCIGQTSSSFEHHLVVVLLQPCAHGISQLLFTQTKKSIDLLAEKTNLVIVSYAGYFHSVVDGYNQAPMESFSCDARLQSLFALLSVFCR